MRAFSLRRICWMIEQEIAHIEQNIADVDYDSVHLRGAKNRIEKLLAYGNKLTAEQDQYEKIIGKTKGIEAVNIQVANQMDSL